MPQTDEIGPYYSSVIPESSLKYGDIVPADPSINNPATTQPTLSSESQFLALIPDDN